MKQWPCRSVRDSMDFVSSHRPYRWINYWGELSKDVFYLSRNGFIMNLMNLKSLMSSLAQALSSSLYIILYDFFSRELSKLYILKDSIKLGSVYGLG
jgi:hypothetical protein